MKVSPNALLFWSVLSLLPQAADADQAGRDEIGLGVFHVTVLSVFSTQTSLHTVQYDT